MKKICIIFLISFVNLCHAATLRIYNTTNITLSMYVTAEGKGSGSIVVAPGKSILFNSGLNDIKKVAWWSNRCSDGWSINNLNMPKMHVEGKLTIKRNGEFDSSRLGNSKQASVTGPFIDPNSPPCARD